MNILHITNWYKSKDQPHKALFIEEHFKASKLYTNGTLYHIEVQTCGSALFRYSHEKISESEESFIIKTSLKKWFFKEIITFILLKYVLKFHAPQDVDLINIHVGYPLLTWVKSKYSFNKPCFVIEHWTAFHYNFNLPLGTNKLNRIKNIYRKGIPVVTVSDRLNSDIEHFCNSKQLGCLLPNVVDKDVFYFDPKIPARAKSFFMLNYWRNIKSPFPILKAFKEYIAIHPYAQLRVGGYGPLWDEMNKYVITEKLNDNIRLLGKLTKSAIAKEMRSASAFLHNADYETFSVVCAEAISCGTPVIVNHLEAVAEFIHAKNGIFVDNEGKWLASLIEFEDEKFDRNSISKEANEKFDSHVVGKKYKEIAVRVIEDFYK